MGPDTRPGIVVVDYWQPFNYVQDGVIQGFTLYTDVAFTIGNPIPAGGTIILTFEKVNISSSKWKADSDGILDNGAVNYCYVKWIGKNITCSTINS